MTIICFSHLRWNFVYQRPQHLLLRFAKEHMVYYIEEPVFTQNDDEYIIDNSQNVTVITPHLNENNPTDIHIRQASLLNLLMHKENISTYIFWYYSPMMYLFSKDFHPLLIVYDCMDELSAFKFAPPQLKDAEQELFKVADVVFTGGHSLFQSKKDKHHNIYPFPSSIDKKHFSKARLNNQHPPDQNNITPPRLGFFGVLDERFDIELIRTVATQKPDWNFIFIGPVVKINVEDLPHNDNIFYLGSKQYAELPAYISTWNIALIPFAINESTEFISPTKTPEYLAAGKPVISTAIKDVVTPYGDEGLVKIIHNAKEFIEAATELLQQHDRSRWLTDVDRFLADNSWDNTFNEMNSIIKNTLKYKTKSSNLKTKAHV